MEKFLCTYCGITTSLAKCPDCGRGTIPNLPNSGSMRPLQTVKQRYPTNIPFRPIKAVEADLFNKLVKAAPYYALKYGEQGVDLIIKSIDKKKNPYLYYLCWGLAKGISYVKGKLYVE